MGLTSFLHKDKEVIQKLLSLWVIIQFIKLEMYFKNISNKLINFSSDYFRLFLIYIHLLNLLTLAKSLDGSPLSFPPSVSSAQIALPLCMKTHGEKHQLAVCPPDCLAAGWFRSYFPKASDQNECA